MEEELEEDKLETIGNKITRCALDRWPRASSILDLRPIVSNETYGEPQKRDDALRADAALSVTMGAATWFTEPWPNPLATANIYLRLDYTGPIR